ncbi:MAG: RNA-binding cell elongation regulator Jag/EloR [Thermodesulfobacteriota bacterium]|nr:RNA-binding cell elongation regulator Jag/EloR [Thermodesulfobacteriota bacterium]
MASSSEFEGKNVDAAVRHASREMNIPEDQLEYEILSSGSSGIFGLVGVKNAKIRVVINNQRGAGYESPSMAQDRQDIQSLLDETFAETDGDEGGQAPAPEKKPRYRKSSFSKKPEQGRKAHRQTAADPTTTAPAPPAAEHPDSSGSSEPATKPVAEPATEPATESAPAPPSFNEADYAAGKEALQMILDIITSDSTVSVSYHNDHVLFTVTGGNAAVLIGKRGKTLKAIQHLIEKIVRKSCGDSVDVLVDVEQYLEKREESLRTLAQRLAEKTSQTGKPSTINRIDSFERKIVHDALRKDKRVRTRSVGNGDLRNVVIHPGKKAKCGQQQTQQDEQNA